MAEGRQVKMTCSVLHPYPGLLYSLYLAHGNAGVERRFSDPGKTVTVRDSF